MKNTKQLNQYQKGILNTMANYDEILIDHIWTLFNNLEDNSNPELVEAACYLIQNYKFDMEALPEKLYNATDQELKLQAKEQHAFDLAATYIENEELDIP